MLKTFDEIVSQVKSSKNRRIAVAMAQDADILEALEKAKSADIADAVLIGNQIEIEKIARDAKIDLSALEIIDISDESLAVKKAIELVRNNEADLLMKGLCSTAALLKGVLDRDTGLRGRGLLSHLAIFQIKTYPKLILMSDAAMNIAPTLEEKIDILKNAVDAAHRLNIETPKVAMITAVEKINPGKMPATTDAAIIAKMSDRDQIKGAIVDGPLALDNAFSKKSCEIKGITSEVGGETDIAIVPDIESGNIFYKLMSYLAGARTAGLIIGARVPIILTSRADSDETKFLSIATAARIS